MRFPLLCLLAVLFLGHARAEEPFFKKGDVIALVGGEDMVTLSETGTFETIVRRALPDYHLRFRDLAWEGDTVYDQRRDLNFPSWEEQLDKIGATVVICQFGQMESLDGKDKVSDFFAAYEKLVQRFKGGGKRRVVMVSPIRGQSNGPFFPPSESEHSPALLQSLERINENLPYYVSACYGLAEKECAVPLVGIAATIPEGAVIAQTRDGIHLTPFDYFPYMWAATIADALHVPAGTKPEDSLELGRGFRPINSVVVAKNRLWFNYWRVQNWAFLAGDRTNQPSSRDWRDPSKRWFPAEREEFLPLIGAKEKEIDELAAKLKSN